MQIIQDSVPRRLVLVVLKAPKGSVWKEGHHAQSITRLKCNNKENEYFYTPVMYV